MPTKPKIALVKDWLTSYGGSEEQLLQLHQLYPEAPIYTTVYDPKRLPQFDQAKIHTMNVPVFWQTGRRFEKLAPLMPRYFRRLDLSEYDLVISVTSGLAKGLTIKRPTKHICICNTPLRLAWGFGGDDRGLMSRLFGRLMRSADVKGSQSVDVFYANSNNVAKRIEAVYGRKSKVLYPPVHVEKFAVPAADNREGFITTSRLVPYKRVDLIVSACTELNLPLTVVGEGPERQRLEALAGPTVQFLGFVSDDRIKQLYRQAQAFIFAADEDFGIAPVEAMAAGLPVIAYQAGGALETVKPGVSGDFFADQTVQSLASVLQKFEGNKYENSAIKRYAKQFSVDIFTAGIKKAVDDALSPRFTRL